MASALDAVLQLKAQETARAKEQSDQISQAVQIFQNARQQAVQNKMAQLEYAQKERKYQSDVSQQLIENTLKEKQLTSMDEYLKLLGGNGNPSSSESIPPDPNAIPTLQDAFPIPTQNFIQTPYLSPGGKVGMSNKLDPQYNKKLELRNSQIKELDEISKPVESFAVGVQSLRDAIQNTPDFKPGFLSGPKAMVTNKLAEINNEPWFTNYNLAYQQNFLPAAQALGSSKVLSDKDLENIKQSLGNPTIPKDVKIKALDDLASKVSGATNSKLNAYGANKDIYSKIYPNTAREFIKQKGITGTQQFNVGGVVYNIPADKVEAFKKAKGL